MDNLKDIQIKTAKPKDKPYKIYDGKGLFIHIMPNGSKFWRLKYSYGGKEKTLSIGTYPITSLKDAREARFEALKQKQDGIDPSAFKQTQKLEIKNKGKNTFEAIAKEWFDTQMQDKSQSHRKRTLANCEKYLYPAFGKAPIKEIKPPMILLALRKIEQRGYIESAKKVRQTASQIFCYAVSNGQVDRDPTTDIKRALQSRKVNHYPTILEPKKIGKLMLAIEHYQGTVEVMTALKLSPLLFVRQGELRHMEWSEIDWAKRIWEIPADKMKMGEPHIVPLSKQALKELQRIKPLNEHRSKYVFPSARGTTRPLSDNAVRVALRSLGYSKEMIVPHGFRAMARTLLDEELGYRIDYIEQQLAHAVKDPTGRAYNRTKHLEQRKEMMQHWADYLGKLKAQAMGLRIITTQ